MATPPASVSARGIRSYSGDLTLDAAGVVTAGSLTDDQSTVYTVTAWIDAKL